MHMYIKKSTLILLTICFSLMLTFSFSASGNPSKDTSAVSISEKDAPAKDAPSKVASAKASKEINWQSYEAGIKKIKDQKKKGFLHFYTDWCTYCKIMNVKTFSDAKIIAYLNDNFIPIRVNAERQKNVAHKYGVNRFPNTWFLAEDSSNLSSQPGFIPAEKLLAILKFLNTDSFKRMEFSDYMKLQENQTKTEKVN
jgi:thioredoxin-related protein